jgi:hypothetical protein
MGKGSRKGVDFGGGGGVEMSSSHGPGVKRQVADPAGGAGLEQQEPDPLCTLPFISHNTLHLSEHLDSKFRFPVGSAKMEAVFRIHDILVWIRIRICGSMPLTNGFGCGSGSCYFRH